MSEAETINQSDDVVLLTEVGVQQYEGNEVEVSTGEEGRLIIAGRSRAGDTVCLEPGCDFRCQRIPKLRDHLATVHNFPQPLQTFQFRTEEEFLEWLSKIEDANHCSYMRRRGWQKNKNKSLTACYYCNRGGAYISNASKKQSKQQGTCKTGVECTSSLKVTMWNPPMYKELIEVEAYLQHYGHNFELGHTRIHWHDRKVIEKKLKNGISRHKILDEIRGSLDQTSSLSRIHLVSLQDIYNIEKKCGIKANRGRYCSEAGITAQAWIEAMQQSEDNPVLLIKYQQEAAPEKYKCLGEDDFLLILQTPLQLSMLQKHGPRQFMCIDVTEGNNTLTSSPTKESHEFQLFALEVLIPDENSSKGPYPVAWCVSNRNDGEILKVFFTCIKDNLGGLTLSPGYLFVPSSGVTDSDWFSIWSDTFGAGPRKLISSWHIMEEWRHNLQMRAPVIYASASERARIMGNLETVIRESSIKHFGKIIEECLVDLKTNSLTSNFASFFESLYMSQAELWASAYRTHDAIAADAYLNIFHNRLSKHIYHEALKRKQLDILVKTLMKYTRDNVLPKLRILHKGKSEFHQRVVTASTHKESLNLSLDNIVQSGKHEWQVTTIVDAGTEVTELTEVKSETTKVAVQYTVKVIPGKTCTARLRCPLRCNYCCACPHQMTCTCMTTDESEESKVLADESYMCVHMHQVCHHIYEKGGLRLDNYVVKHTPSAAVEKSEIKQYAMSQKLIECAKLHTKHGNVQKTSENNDVVTDVIITMDAKNDVIDEVSIVENPPKMSSLVLKDDHCESADFCSKRQLENQASDSKPIKVIKLGDIKSGVVFVPANVPLKFIKKEVVK